MRATPCCVLRVCLLALAACCWLDPASAALQNVASLYGTASQSTTGFGLPAGNAIDGNPATISHTDTGDLTAFWEVDFGDSYHLESLNLITRGGCCAPPERDYNLTIEVYDNAGNVAYTNPVINPWDFTGGAAAEIGDGAAFPIDLSSLPGGGVTGQRVRVSKLGASGTEWLSIAELEAFADVALPRELDPNVNVALYKPTTGDEAFGRPTSNGNNGLIGADFTHADNANPAPNNPFWQVDLEGEFALSRIEIVDRGDGCCDPNRLEGSVLSVFAADGSTVLYQSDPIVGLTVPSSGETIGFDFPSPLAGAAHIRVDGFQQYFQFSELRAYQIPEPGCLLSATLALMCSITLLRHRR